MRASWRLVLLLGALRKQGRGFPLLRHMLLGRSNLWFSLRRRRYETYVIEIHPCFRNGLQVSAFGRMPFACSRRTTSWLRVIPCITAPTCRVRASTWVIFVPALCSTVMSNSDNFRLHRIRRPLRSAKFLQLERRDQP